eukprot:CAMPEP_0173193712 /NCGR_PEP_ID=MMETSP1141-20130122/14103_1 /TAXON_ID=483371 /ORGANISM="non described non described, Strain CCMP2298" /LENGTH=121 /DNA_ID=CAMNT_0014118063 /DNA_START=90 /DNA_END=452 /DNA_ORIENTATION=+
MDPVLSSTVDFDAYIKSHLDFSKRNVDQKAVQRQERYVKELASPVASPSRMRRAMTDGERDFRGLSYSDRTTPQRGRPPSAQEQGQAGQGQMQGQEHAQGQLGSQDFLGLNVSRYGLGSRG